MMDAARVYRFVLLLMGSLPVAIWTAEKELEGCYGNNGVHLSETVYACRGEWVGHISNASNLCAAGYHVCRWDDRRSLRQLEAPHVMPSNFAGGELNSDCFAYNAAQNQDSCRPCHGQPGESDQMAGIGRQCASEEYGYRRSVSCLASGRVIHDHGARPHGTESCTYWQHFSTGAVCCKDIEDTTSPSPNPRTPTTSGRLVVDLTYEESNPLVYNASQTDQGFNEPLEETEPPIYFNGCRAQNRSGLYHLRDVAACQGAWSGHVKNADTLCAPGWKVCSHENTEELGSIDFSYSKRRGLQGCFAINAAHSRGQACQRCREGSTVPLQMAGVGSFCYWSRTRTRKASRKERSCFGKGRVDATSYRPRRECSHDVSLSGVVCCRHEMEEPPHRSCGQGCVHGTCNSSMGDNDGVCQCHQDWTGPTCEQAICRPKCRHGGKCIAPNKCQCLPGYSGRLCKPEIRPCSGGCVHGMCNTTRSRQGICQCQDGWSGPTCSQAVCQQPCQNGQCVAPNICVCNKGWKGSSCHRAICKGSCNHGKCVSPDRCRCRKGWSGRRCSRAICKQPCDSRRGRCVSPNICHCFNGYIGKSCEIRLGHLSQSRKNNR
ncbi:adhesive plaque matrix protein 2-like [Sycon ciliatum]|uniref:adhesive plaque matrix protein 2-like n=1 Tax=Sycon ciliatum TaxID=27933 RepID=UPI0031F67D4E